MTVTNLYCVNRPYFLRVSFPTIQDYEEATTGYWTSNAVLHGFSLDQSRRPT